MLIVLKQVIIHIYMMYFHILRLKSLDLKKKKIQDGLADVCTVCHCGTSI